LPENYSYHEKELLTRVADGDQEAFTLIFKRYKQKIYALAYHLTESPVYAEEIVQDVFLKIWLRQRQLSEIADFEAYLFVTARNHIFTYLKAIARQNIAVGEADLHLPFEENTPEAQVLYKEYTTLISEAVRQLPVQQSQVYRLCKEEGKTRAQIATDLSISPETVKVHLSRAMRSIRVYLLARISLSLIWLLLSMIWRKIF
jgi:RNA polymerase sigma-70 factor (family 1)